MEILAVSGSLRSGSCNTALLRAAEEGAPAGFRVTIWEGLKEVPPYDEDDDVQPARPAVAALRAAVAAADAVLFATPEYNSSIPGQLKNALDWLSRPLATNPLRNKPVAAVGASTGMFGGVWAQAELRKVLAAIGARVLDEELAVGRVSDKVSDGRLVDDEVRARLAEIVDALAEQVRERERAAIAA